MLTGKLSGNKRINVADGATITLRGAKITSNSAKYAGITLLGDATILLADDSEVRADVITTIRVFMFPKTKD